ncbi:MFS transporter [Nakamurella silvestris]|nr:MFS transporter [Nakamurella silvestris]
MITVIALPLYVLSTTGSVTATGIAGFFATLPIVIGGALGGVLVDRIGFRRSSIISDLVSGVTIAAVPLLAMTVGLPFWALLLLVFASGLLDTPGQAARTALLPELVATANMSLERAVGGFSAASRAAQLTGAPIAGLLVAWLGPLAVLVVDAATFVLSAALVLGCVPTGGVRTPVVGEAESGYWAQLRGGLRFVRTQPLLRAIVLMVLVTNLFDAARGSVLLPVYADSQLDGAVAFGLVVGAMGGGSLIGSLVYGAVGARWPRRATFVISFVLAGAPPYIAMAAGANLTLLLVITALSGLAGGTLNPILGVLMLERVPVGMRATVNGLVNAGCWAAVPLGSLVAGFGVEHLGLTAMFWVVGVLYLLVTLSPLRGGPWRTMERPAVSGPDFEVPAPADPASR